MSIEHALNYINGIKGNRRQTLALGGAGTGLTLLALAKCQISEGEQRVHRSPAQIQEYIQRGAYMRTPDDLQAVFRTRSDADIPFSTLANARRIRAIEDPIQRVMAAAGYLDVENPGNKRYSLPDDGACNIYALDFLRLILGNSDIGSRSNRRSGAPTVLGINDANWDDTATIERFGAENPYLAAFNLDDWMRTYGPRYGWMMMNSSAKLNELMHTGEYIGLGVSKREDTRNRPGNGHAFLTLYADAGYGWSQATNHVRYKTIAETDIKARPGEAYNIHLHKIPNSPQ